MPEGCSVESRFSASSHILRVWREERCQSRSREEAKRGGADRLGSLGRKLRHLQ